MNTETQKQFEEFAEERRQSCTTISPINMKEMIEKVNIKLGNPPRKGIGRKTITKQELVELYVKLSWKLQNKQLKIEEKENKEMKTATKKKATAKKKTATKKKATAKKATAKKATAKKATTKKATAKKATATGANRAPRMDKDTVITLKKFSNKQAEAMELLGMREGNMFFLSWEVTKVLNKLKKKATLGEIKEAMPTEPKNYPADWGISARVMQGLKDSGVVSF